MLNTLSLQYKITKYVQVLKSGYLEVIYSYISSMKFMTNWYWLPEYNQHIVIVSIDTVVNPSLYVSLVTYVVDI